VGFWGELLEVGVSASASLAESALELDADGARISLGGMNTTPMRRSLNSQTSRRDFIATTAGAISAASLGWTRAAAQAPAAPGEKKEKGLRVGMLTMPLQKEPFTEVLDMAKRCQIAALEVVAHPGGKHVDPMTFGPAEAENIKKMLAERGLEISSLSNYQNPMAPGKTEEFQNTLKKTIDAAVLLGVPVVCTNTGVPQEKEKADKIGLIKKVTPKIFRPILDHAKEKGIKVAVENWFATCLQGLDTFDCLFEAIPDEHFGLNYDPSHLVHQQCDHLVPVAKFSKRLFHTHAKDCLVDLQKRNYVGVLGKGWWRYAIPGYGDIKWGEYISLLRDVGYKGVLSIEHEDRAFAPEDGFRHGARYLNQFC
jgi:sugar phosphate isomerase/epimerase